MARHQNSLGGIVSTAKAATAIARDPHLPEVVRLVLRLQSIESGSSPTRSSAGVGLRNVVGPLRTFVAVQSKPWIIPVVVIGVFGAVFAAGYYTRKATK